MALKKNTKHKDMLVKKQQPKFYKIVTLIFKVNLKVLAYILNIVLSLLLIGIITGAIVGGAFAIYVNRYIDPTPPEIAVKAAEYDMTTTIYYRKYADKANNPDDYEWVENVSERIHSSENRLWARYTEFPEDLVNALVAIEDKRFFDHKGVDWWRTGGVILKYATSDSMQGGSTLTQQLIKMMTGEDDQRPQRKIQEILRALNLEKDTSKEEIIENYLNIASFANGCYGIQSAANYYFSKDVRELNLMECAALVAIVNSPSSFNPIVHPEKNKERRTQVLFEMQDNGFITREQYDELKDQELVLNRNLKSYNESVKSYFTDQVMTEVMDALQLKYPGMTREQASNMLFSGGLKIYTTMDYDIQRTMEYVYVEHPDEYFPDRNYTFAEGEAKPQSAMVIIDPYTGDLLGIVGGRGEKKTQRGLNRASGSKRQPGSSIKPLSAYALALDRGLITYGSVNDDVPTIFFKNGGWPTNYPRGFNGYCTTHYAIQVSKNTVATKLIQDLTPDYVYNFLKYKLNISTLVDGETTPSGVTYSDKDLSPLGLGGMTYGTTLYDLTGAYTMFANKGLYCKPRAFLKILDSNNNVIIDNELPKKTPIISEETAVIMTQMLREVVTVGTAKTLGMKSKIQVAGKTGTTNDDKDKVFIGYTPYYLCGVWYGYDDPLALGKFGLSPAIFLFNTVMDTIHTNLYSQNKEFEIPSTVIQAKYCAYSGMLPSEACSKDPRGSRIETGYFARGSAPIYECTNHVEVDMCKDYNCVAGPNCPSTKKMSLVRNETREFPIQVYVTDAQYTYREVPYDYIYPSSMSLPFYANLLPAGKYSGTSGVEIPYNAFCVVHNPQMTLPLDQRKEEKPEPEETTTEKTTEETTVAEETTSTEKTTESESTTEPTVQEMTEETERPTEETTEKEESPTEATIGAIQEEVQ